MAARAVKRGRVLRPIEKIVTSDDRVAADLFSMSLAGKFTKGPEAYAQTFAGVTAGRTIGAGLGGGIFSPLRSTAHFTQNGSNAPVYP